MEQIERLTNEEAEVITRADNSQHISGYAIVFYDGTPKTEYSLGGNRVERVAPDAVTDDILRSDVECWLNHSEDYPLDDTEHNLTLSKDKRGVRYSFPVDREDPQHLTALAKIKKKQIKGSSFRAEVSFNWSMEGDKAVRTINRFYNLQHVSPVYRPAYKSTTAICRAESEAEIEKSYQDWQQKIETQKRIERANAIIE